MTIPQIIQNVKFKIETRFISQAYDADSLREVYTIYNILRDKL